jgi:hypothetical protein
MWAGTGIRLYLELSANRPMSAYVSIFSGFIQPARTHIRAVAPKGK